MFEIMAYTTGYVVVASIFFTILDRVFHFVEDWSVIVDVGEIMFFAVISLLWPAFLLVSPFAMIGGITFKLTDKLFSSIVRLASEK